MAEEADEPVADGPEDVPVDRERALEHLARARAALVSGEGE